MNSPALEYKKTVQQSKKRGPAAVSPAEREKFSKLIFGSVDLRIDAKTQSTDVEMSPSSAALHLLLRRLESRYEPQQRARIGGEN